MGCNWTAGAQRTSAKQNLLLQDSRLAADPITVWNNPEAVVQGIPVCPELCSEPQIALLPGTGARAEESQTPGLQGRTHNGETVE